MSKFAILTKNDDFSSFFRGLRPGVKNLGEPLIQAQASLNKRGSELNGTEFYDQKPPFQEPKTWILSESVVTEILRKISQNFRDHGSTQNPGFGSLKWGFLDLRLRPLGLRTQRAQRDPFLKLAFLKKAKPLRHRSFVRRRALGLKSQRQSTVKMSRLLLTFLVSQTGSTFFENLFSKSRDQATTMGARAKKGRKLQASGLQFSNFINQKKDRLSTHGPRSQTASTFLEGF